MPLFICFEYHFSKLSRKQTSTSTSTRTNEVGKVGS